MAWVELIKIGRFDAIPASFSWQTSAEFAHLIDGYAIMVNRPGFVGGSNFQIRWSRYEQDDEQILP